MVSGDIAGTIDHLRDSDRVRFVDWSPCGFKTGINTQPMSCVPDSDFAAVNRSVCMVRSSDGVGFGLPAHYWLEILTFRRL